MSSRVRPEEAIILKHLSSKGREYIYFFHEKYHLLPAQMGRVIRKYAKMGIISQRGDYLGLTEKGKQFVINNRKKLFLVPKNRFWARKVHPFRTEAGDNGTDYLLGDLSILLEEGL